MQTLLIAEESAEVANCIVRLLRGEFQISVCYDGDMALDMLEKNRPDILILNLMLPFKDGLTLLQESSYRPPHILAYSHFINGYTAERAMELGIGALLNNPTPRTVTLRLVDFLSGRSPEEKEQTPQSKIALQLHLLRFASYLDGYRQLCVGIPLFHEDPQQNLSKELYPAIARICGYKTEKCVEHSIRKAIQNAWKRRTPGAWEQFFPNITRCPSNKAFLARMAELLDE